MKINFNTKSNVNMRKKIVILSELLVLFLVIGSSIGMANPGFSEQNKASEPALAPENPEFVQYQTNIISTQPGPSLDGYKTGFIPPTVDLNHLDSISTGNVATPAYYDLRTLNRVTPVKDQGSAGSCWAFATYGSLESCLMSGESWDFSENNIKNLLSSEYPEGFDRNPNGGGNEFMSTAYLARWSGPVDEKDDPYDPNSAISPQNLLTQKHVQNVLFIPNRKGSMDNEGIKWAVQKYGEVYTTFYFDSAYYSPTTYSYYYNGTSLLNHAVAIVGWDDSFDKNKFSSVPPGNGAFIIKNSWGPGWGENGYFYISYYDSRIGNYNAVFTGEPIGNYKNIYQYDPLGWVTSMGYSNPSAWCANIFTAKSDEALKAVSFYTTDSNCNYEIYIYTNPESTPISPDGPILTQSGTSSLAGYHTIPLSSEIQLKSGQKFSVVIKLTTSGYSYPIPMEMPRSGYSSKAAANLGESFVSYDGNSWADLTTYYSNTNVCIKAFTDITGSTLPVADFSASPTSGPAPLEVSFTDASTGIPTSLLWDFGDGSTSTDQNPKYIYSTEGNYTVTLTVSNAVGTDTKTISNCISAFDVPILPVADFSASQTSGNAPLTVAFTDKSTGSPTEWKWSFGDGSALVTQYNPTYTYSKPGTYTVKETVSNAAGKDTEIKTNYITVTSPLQAPVADFSASQISGNAPLTVAFTDKSTGSPTAWKWSFGDGSALVTQYNPTYTYSKPGTYTVKETVSNAAGKDTEIKTNYITVKSVLIKPAAAFSASPTSGYAPLKVTFTDKSTGTPTSWKWSFGDGTYSTTKNSAHTYSKAGKYTISLTATNKAGSNTATKSSYIVVSILKAPVASFSASPTSGKAPLKVQFTDKSTNGPTSWKWSFGDGTYSTSKSPSHTYSKAGKYSVSLTAKNAKGSNTKTMSGYIVVSK